MKLRLEIILGAILLAVVGPFRFHFLAQADGLLASIARRFLAHRWVVKPVRYHAEFLADRERDSITDYAVRTYSGEDLGGWGAETLRHGDQHLPLGDQIQSLALGDIEKAIGRCRNRTPNPLRVIEIGTGNGRLLADIASRHADVEFLGIDLSVSHAERRHRAPNIRFVGGYALDLLESGEIDAQIAFANSTLAVMPPRELARYIAALTKSGVRELLVVDPMSQIYHPERYPGRSVHLASGMWGHDYRHYLKDRASSIEVSYIDYRLNPRRPVLRLQKVVATIKD